MEPLLVFESYNFGNLDRSWIKKVWDSSFSDTDNAPRDYLIFLESQDILELLSDTSGVLKAWMYQNSTEEPSTSGESPTEASDEVSWQTLVALDLDVRALLAVLAYLMKRGQAFDASQDSRQSCLRATGLYFILLSIPGSNAFQAFHPSLYEMALKSLSLSRRLVSVSGNVAKKSRTDALEEDSEQEDEESEKTCPLSKSQTTTLTRGLNGVLYDLLKMLKEACTSLETHSLERTVFHLVELTKLAEETVCDSPKMRRPMADASVSSLAYNAYVALRLLCNPRFAPVPTITRIIGKYVLPQLLIVSNSKLPQKQLTIIRDSTIHFLKTLLDKHGRDAQTAVVTLVQHLMIKSPERVEGRQKQAIVVIKLMNLCGSKMGSVYEKCLKDLVQLSHHNKTCCRIFAQVIIGRFLLDLSSSKSPNLETEAEREEETSSWSSSKTKKLLLGAALSRCVDSSSIVRGRAIATFAEYTDSIESPEVKDLFIPEESAEDCEMPSLENLLEAIEESSVDEILPNTRGIVRMLKRRGEDERALVRRSAMQALCNGVLTSPALLQEALPMLRAHCRDAALTVRRYGIRVLTTLLERFPDNPGLCRDWVDSVVPRVFDTEPKVQEEVLEALHKLTVGKIREFDPRTLENNSISEALPWKILSELAANKMVDHLTKACGIWVKDGIVSDSTLSRVKSHIGTEHDVEAWLLLASISESKPLENMEDYCDYYRRALREDSEEKGFLSCTVLRVLRNSWSTFEDSSLKKIHKELLDSLRHFSVRGTLISHCLDILDGIGKFRALESSQSCNEASRTMSDLVRLSEATMIHRLESAHDTSNEEDCGKLLFRAILTLGHSSFLSSEKITISSLRILQGFLLEWNMLPETLKDKKELQGAAVTVLGQQALRDRDVAQEMTPIFGRLLRNTTRDSRTTKMASGPAVRINAAKALADICVRFTALVEPYLPDMCISMKDSNPDVRRVILVIFIQLLAEDFIKINGPFFFHILTMLSDEDETIRQMTVFLVKERLLSKNKSLVTQQFVHSLFHFNDYERRIGGAGSSGRKRRAKEREALALPGEKGLDERRRIYEFLLEHLDAPGKLTVLVQLSRLLLKSRAVKGASSALVELNVTTQKGVWLFKDVLHVLASDHLQPNSCSKHVLDEDNLEDTPVVTTSAANTLILEAMKKHRLQVLLPGLVELKRRLAAAKSSLVVDVAKYLQKLVTEHNKDQLDNLYNEYPKLDRELERDVKSFQGEKRRVDEEDVEEERPEKTRKSSTPKKGSENACALINPDWIPRIVLRRLSSLTYPEISGLRRRVTSESESESYSRTPGSPFIDERPSSSRSERSRRRDTRT